jgi:hypothetical protein
MAKKKASSRKPKARAATRRKDATPVARVFIGWSGSQSKAVAEVLHSCFPRVIQAIQPFMSELDIPSGARWQSTLDDELKTADFGIVCLTPENLSAPWVLFESGALSALKDRAVCPYLFRLGSAQVQGPLTVFQNNAATKAGTLKLVRDLNELLENPVEPGVLSDTFARWWNELETALNGIPESTARRPAPRPEGQMLEELLLLVRDLTRRRSFPFRTLPTGPIARSLPTEELERMLRRSADEIRRHHSEHEKLSKLIHERIEEEEEAAKAKARKAVEPPSDP